jgi:hypothetical protein
MKNIYKEGELTACSTLVKGEVDESPEKKKQKSKSPAL